MDKTRVKEVYICFQKVPSDGVGSGNNCYDVDEVCINDYLIRNLCSADRQKFMFDASSFSVINEISLSFSLSLTKPQATRTGIFFSSDYD